MNLSRRTLWKKSDGPIAATLRHLIFYFSENFPHNFTQGALLIAECLADYYSTGELVVYDYVGENYDPVEHHIKEFVVTKADLQLLLEKLQSVQNPEHWLYRSWFRDETREEWLAHIQSVYPTICLPFDDQMRRLM